MPKPNHAAFAVFAVLSIPALALGGCQTASDTTTAATRSSFGQTVFDLVGVTVPLTAGELRDYNGSYQGTVRQVVAKGPSCPTEHGERVIMVGDGVLWYAYSPVTYFTAPVQYDGTIEATSGAARMSGRVVGNHLGATVTTPECETRLNMDIILNH